MELEKTDSNTIMENMGTVTDMDTAMAMAMGMVQMKNKVRVGF
tara:strand:- start:1857 stop:1985 length:129 start_codon:yes stop_codon:yes gene_type:complete